MIAQTELFDMSYAPSRAESRHSYHELGIYDVDASGCSEWLDMFTRSWPTGKSRNGR